MGNFRAGLVAAFLGLALVVQPVAAREDLAVDAGKGWTHPHSGIEVPYSLGGIERSNALAFADDFLDVGFAFDSADGAEALSVYIFRNTNGGLPVWFAQAQWAIENRAMYGTIEPHTGPVKFDPRVDGMGAGLKAVYATSGPSEFSSTGVAIFLVGEWFVKLRASSTSRSPEELDAWLDKALAELVVPSGAVFSDDAVEMVDCPDRLEFKKKSKDAPQELGSLLIGGLLGAMIAGGELEDEESEPTEPLMPVRWCRDHSLGNAQAVYRPDGAADSYLLAIGDNGNAVRVGPEAGLEALLGESSGGKKRYTVTLLTAGLNTSYIAQDRLPSPQRVLELIDKDRTTMSVPTWGDEDSINISADAID